MATWPKARPQPMTPSPPAESSTSPDAEWADKPARVARHGVQSHRGAAQMPDRRPALCRRSAPNCRGRSRYSTPARRGGERDGKTPAVQPVASASAAAAVIAHSTTLPRPYRCAVSLPVTDTAMPASPASVNSTAGPGSQAGAPSRAARGGQERHRPGAQGRQLPGVHRVADDPGHGAAVAEYRPEVQQRPCWRRCRRGPGRRASPSPQWRRRLAAAMAPNRKAALGPASASNRLAAAKESAPAMPTPAACQDTARDCAAPSSGSAIAFSPGM